MSPSTLRELDGLEVALGKPGRKFRRISATLLRSLKRKGVLKHLTPEATSLRWPRLSRLAQVAHAAQSKQGPGGDA